MTAVRHVIDCTTGEETVEDFTADEQAAADAASALAAKDAADRAAADDVLAKARQVIAAKLDPDTADPSTDALLSALATVVGD